MNVKLMKGLQECIRGHECQKCPYFLTNDCRATLLADAEDLLGDAPTRVLTWEKVSHSFGHGWLELVIPPDTSAGETEPSEWLYECVWMDGDILGQPEDCDYCEHFEKKYNAKYYNNPGDGFRIWTWLPTDEQRREAKWG